MMAIFRLCSGNMNRKWELMNEKEGLSGGQSRKETVAE